MKTFFIVKQADDTAGYSGRFNVSNDDLDISVDNYNLLIAIDEFIIKFKSKYCYWDNVYARHLNKEALTISSIYMSYEEAYRRLKEVK